MPITVFAPAKLNLYLHVTGRRADGYHELDSLVAFLSAGDTLVAEPAAQFSFTATGPMAPALGSDNSGNLVVRAAQALAQTLGKPLDVALTLTKNLPVASGIGGGSTDAAAALHALCQHWRVTPDPALLHGIAKALGQDVPVCLAARPAYFKGIGDETDPGPALPAFWCVLVNPGVPVPTPAVFKARTGAFTPRSRLDAPPRDLAHLIAMLKDRRNDLTEPACTVAPVIRTALEALERTSGCLLARMAGSGPTCFGIFVNQQDATTAAGAIQQQHPAWWVQAAGQYQSQREAA